MPLCSLHAHLAFVLTHTPTFTGVHIHISYSKTWWTKVPCRTADHRRADGARMGGRAICNIHTPSHSLLQLGAQCHVCGGYHVCPYSAYPDKHEGIPYAFNCTACIYLFSSSHSQRSYASLISANRNTVLKAYAWAAHNHARSRWCVRHAVLVCFMLSCNDGQELLFCVDGNSSSARHKLFLMCVRSFSHFLFLRHRIMCWPGPLPKGWWWWLLLLL